ncbi:MAG: ABC transporter ATP-binding protein, partial [Nocardioidaceae bacterium]
MSRVRLAGVGRSFGAHRVLDGVDLDIADGEIMGVLGPSGCGKTTMLRIIAGFLAPDEGELFFDATPVAGLSPQRRRVGYVPQEGALFPHLDVRGNILFGLPRKERTDERAAELLDLADLDPTLLHSFPHQLSGGQQQRVALARALAPRPRVVLLDEPFSSLDASLRVSAGRAVTRVLRAAGTTAVLVTHDQGEALSLTDRVAVLRQGRVAQVDSPVRLYRSPVDVGVATFV